MTAHSHSSDRSAWRAWWRAGVVMLAAALVAMVGLALPALALKSIPLTADVDMVEVTEHAELMTPRGDSLQVETAPAADGMTGRMSVRASSPGLSPNWVVFALRNATDRPMERWVTAERYALIGSGIVWPNLDARRLIQITPSLGFLPEQIPSDRADIFKVTLEPGQTVTYVAELATERVGRVFVWKPVEYELKVRDRQLYNGILLGITGVLGIFLTAVFAANHKPIFPSAALVTWCVLAYLCVDFGFWHKLFQLRPEDNAVYRAATEAAMAASLLVFLHIFLRLTASPGLARMLIVVWIIAQIGLVGLAVIDARLAATFARTSFAAIGAVGIIVSAYLALRGQDRALSLLPTWILFLVWLFAATVTLTGRMQGDAVVSSLTGGLVLITVLVGFTVTQFAFRSVDTHDGATPSEQTLRSLAIDGSGASVWEWNVRRDEVRTGPLVEATLGLKPGELSVKSEDFCAHLHPADRERFRLLLWSVNERGGGEIRLDMRMLHADNSYRWFDLEAAAAPSSDRRSLRCVGLMREITESKRAQERLLHDSVHDSLTGLPNRELFLDRLGVAVDRARREPMIMPAVILIDVDKFRSVNASFGLVVGDSLLLTLARRLQKNLGPQDTLARISGNQFAVMLMQAHDPADISALAETIRRSVRSPIKIAGQDVVLTAALGISIWDNKIAAAADLLKDAEVAMYRAKRGGADRVETFHAQMRHEVDDRVAVESELRAALERRELIVLYQPIISLATEELAGFEALVRWQHPKLGLLSPGDFIPIAEASDLIVELGSQVLSRAVEASAQWHKLLPRQDRPLFVSVNVSSRQLFRADLVQEVKQVIGRSLVPPGGLRLEITETLVMENPERAVEVLDQLRSAGAGLALDDFGTGYSSLSYLNRFPFDTIKIDRDLVQAGMTDGSGSAIVRSIVALSHELGKKVVAEGVEAESDVGFLRSIGCEYAQGYYYGEPLSQREAERAVRAVAKTERRMQGVGFFRTKTRKKSNPSVEPGRVPDEMVQAGAAEADGGAAAGAGKPATPARRIGQGLIGKGVRQRERPAAAPTRKGGNKRPAAPARGTAAQAATVHAGAGHPVSGPDSGQTVQTGANGVGYDAPLTGYPTGHQTGHGNGPPAEPYGGHPQMAANGMMGHGAPENGGPAAPAGYPPPQPAPVVTYQSSNQGQQPPAGYWPPVVAAGPAGPPPPPMPSMAPVPGGSLPDITGSLAGLANLIATAGGQRPPESGAGAASGEPVPPALRQPAGGEASGYADPSGAGFALGHHNGNATQPPSDNWPGAAQQTGLPSQSPPSSNAPRAADLSNLPPAIAASLARLSRTSPSHTDGRPVVKVDSDTDK